MPPLVSVVIPCYRQAQFLAAAIESVLGQACRSFEVIVVNDGSPDTEVMELVLAPFLDRVAYLRQENLGVAVARNAGFERCTGEFAVFLDADDRLLPNALEVGAAALAARPKCGLVWGLRNIIDANGMPTRHHVGMTGTGERYIDLLQTNIIGPPVGVVWRSSAVRAVGGFSSVPRFAGDYDAYLRIAQQHDIHFHGATVAEYRLHGNNRSADNAGMFAGVMKVLDGQRAWIGDNIELRRALHAGRRDVMYRYDWSPRFDELLALMKADQWARASAAAALLLGRYPVWTAPALLRSAGHIVRRRAVSDRVTRARES